MTKPSRDVLRLARELIRISSTDWSEAEADRFLDQLNPSIRRALLLEHLTGPGDRLKPDADYQRNKIAAIKQIRAATGWGLKESKEFVELAGGEVNEIYINGRHLTLALIPDIGSESRVRLGRELVGTGYQLE